MRDNDEFYIDGEIVNDSFSSRAPHVELEPLRFLFRNNTAQFFVWILLGAFLLIVLSVVMGWLVFGVVVSLLFVMSTLVVSRMVAVRKIEFKNAFLAPGVLVSSDPLKIAILANMTCDGSGDERWAVHLTKTSDVRPFKSHVGTRVPCVCGFLGDGTNGHWDGIIGTLLSDGCSNREILDRSLKRLNDPEEWGILETAVRQGRLPEEVEQIVFLGQKPPPLPK